MSGLERERPIRWKRWDRLELVADAARAMPSEASNTAGWYRAYGALQWALRLLDREPVRLRKSRTKRRSR